MSNKILYLSNPDYYYDSSCVQRNLIEIIQQTHLMWPFNIRIK
jgi:hypothetical protein